MTPINDCKQKSNSNSEVELDKTHTHLPVSVLSVCVYIGHVHHFYPSNHHFGLRTVVPIKSLRIRHICLSSSHHHLRGIREHRRRTQMHAAKVAHSGRLHIHWGRKPIWITRERSFSQRSCKYFYLMSCKMYEKWNIRIL